MFGSVGGGEIILLLVLALLLFGPRKLPKIGRTIGSALSEFRKATTDFRSNLEREVDLSDLREARRDISDAVREVKGVARGSVLGAAKGAADAVAERPPLRSSEDGALAAEPDAESPASESAETPAAPADGKANKAVIRLVASFLDIAPSRIRLVKGQTQRNKVLRISGPVELPPVIFHDPDTNGL